MLNILVVGRFISYEIHFNKSKVDLNINSFAFDCVIITSLVLEEQNSSIKQKKKQGETCKQLMEVYKRKGRIILLDTVSYEFKLIIERKLSNLYQYLWKYLQKAEKRIREGEKDTDVVQYYTNKIKTDPHYSSIYTYVEKRGMGFFKLLDKEFRIKFINLLLSESEILKKNIMKLQELLSKNL